MDAQLPRNVQVIGAERPADKQHAHINAGMNGSCIAGKQQSCEAHEAGRRKLPNAAPAVKKGKYLTL